MHCSAGKPSGASPAPVVAEDEALCAPAAALRALLLLRKHEYARVQDDTLRLKYELLRDLVRLLQDVKHCIKQPQSNGEEQSQNPTQAVYEVTTRLKMPLSCLHTTPV
eukprot:GHRQ01028948.1.p1 GENE.GHRQ01028948.1~~GHRQ01028948.1.p1  ORF type:complete len:108 (+),score=3.19 GHRQ01028948.1:333-656(+)